MFTNFPKCAPRVRATSTMDSMEVGTYQSMGSQVLSPNYDMDAWQQYLKVRLGTRVESWIEQKIYTQLSQHMTRKDVHTKQRRSNLNDK